MSKRYASMPGWLCRWFKITLRMDMTCFRMHDHDYGTAGYVVGTWQRAVSRAEADGNLRGRLIECGMKPWRARLIWLDCRMLLWRKWRR